MKVAKTTLMLLGLTVFGLAACKQTPKTATGTKQAPVKTVKAGKKAAEQVKVDFYVMSKCPYGAQVIKGIKPVLDKLGNAIDFNLYYIGQNKAGALTSMHGPTEVKGDKLVLCTRKYAPDKYMDVAFCMAKTRGNTPKNFDACATEAKLGPLTAKIKACTDGKEGTDLLAKTFEESKKKGARGSPTMYIAGALYRGGRSPQDFTRAICGHFKSWKPEACKKLPPPVKVSMIVLTDKRCKNCRTRRITSQLKGMLPKLDIKVLDYTTPEGKKLYTELHAKGLTLLPGYLFDQKIKKASAYNMLKRFLIPTGQYLNLKVGAKFDPTKEICDNKKDDTGNGKIDCADPGCKNSMACRKEIPKKLEVFVMSHCPFGIKALNALKEITNNFGKNIKLEIHYIARQMGPGKFSSMHGPTEVEEDKRELCAMKYYGKNYKFMNYILCRNKNIRDNNWKKCATKGVKAAVIEKCSTGAEGAKLLGEDLKIAQALGIGASPTWMANNKFKFSGIAAEQIKQNFCAHNKGLKGCKNKLSTKAKGRAGSCGH